MKTVFIIPIVFLLLITTPFSTPNLLQTPSSNDGPKMEWVYGGFLCIDGIAIYPGEETYSVSVWVSDPDGISSVIFNFLSQYGNSISLTGILTDNNDTAEKYRATLVYLIPWPMGGIISYEITARANDTLGNTAEITGAGFSAAYGPNWPFIFIIAVIFLLCLKGIKGKHFH
jgi:hypothetical protein